MNLSFIIPTLNEEQTLLSNLIFLKKIRKFLSAELIVVDGGSHDSTVNIAKTLSCNVYISEPSRSCLLYTSPSPRDGLLSRMPSSA